jgi:hypothetical protein
VSSQYGREGGGGSAPRGCRFRADLARTWACGAQGLIPACSTLTFEVELIEIIPKDVLKARREAAKAAAKAAGMPMEFDEDEDDE